MKVIWFFILFIVFAYILTIVGSSPPYGLEELPKTTDEITLQKWRE